MLMVECVNNKGAEGGLTVGEIYYISLDEVDSELIYIHVNDAGIENIGYDRSNFKYHVKKVTK